MSSVSTLLSATSGNVERIDSTTSGNVEHIDPRSGHQGPFQWMQGFGRLRLVQWMQGLRYLDQCVDGSSQ